MECQLVPSIFYILFNQSSINSGLTYFVLINFCYFYFYLMFIFYGSFIAFIKPALLHGFYFVLLLLGDVKYIYKYINKLCGMKTKDICAQFFPILSNSFQFVIARLPVRCKKLIPPDFRIGGHGMYDKLGSLRDTMNLI